MSRTFQLLPAILVATCLSITATSQDAAKVRLSVDNVFDLLSLTMSSNDKLSVEAWQKTLKASGLIGVQGGEMWGLTDDSATIAATSTTEGRSLGFTVQLSYHTPLAIAPTMLELLTKQAESTKPGAQSTLMLFLPKETPRDRRCTKQTNYVISFEGQMVSKGVSLICPK